MQKVTVRGTTIPGHDVNSLGAGEVGVLLLLCSVVGEVPSGGDLLALELVKRWQQAAGPVSILTSVSGMRQANEVGLVRANVSLLQRHSGAISSVALSYILRTIEAPGATRRSLSAEGRDSRFVFSASPFLPD